MGSWSKLAHGENEYGADDGHLGKWVFGENIYLGEWSTGGNGHWSKWTPRQMDIWGKELPQVSVLTSPNVYKWALGHFIGANGHLEERGTPSARRLFPPNLC